MNKKIVFLIMMVLIGFVSCNNDLLDTYDDSVVYNLRDRGPVGGLIFYINPNYKTDGWRYLEAAPEDAGTTSEWLSSDRFLNNDLADGGTLTAIGTGKNNTAKILQYKGSDTAGAAEYCDTLMVNGYSDWFLPSNDELNQMCWILHSRKYNAEDNPAYGANRVGGFTVIGYYWSSSELVIDGSRLQSFNGGLQFSSQKSNNQNLRAVRAF